MSDAGEALWLEALGRVLDRSHLFQGDELAGAVGAAMAPLGIRTVLYLVDEEQRDLRIVPQDARPVAGPLSLEASLPGRAFRLVETVLMAGGDGWWVPVVNGTDRLGVLGFTFADDVDRHDDLTRRRCQTIAGLVGHLITVTAAKGDYLMQVRRARPMSDGAELLSQILPPMTVSCKRLTLSAVLEPRYDIGGDGYDYALDGEFARMAIFDGVGRGLRAGLAYAVAVTATRAARRAGHDLHEQVRAADAALLEQFDDARFVTAVLGELNMATGVLRYINAGHPAPLLLRGGKFIRELPGGRRMPLGLNDTRERVGTEQLEPGDRLLFYTDGVIEARDANGAMFGVEALIDHAERHAADGLPAPEMLRRLARAVGAHHSGPAADDTTLVLTEWSPEAVHRSIPTLRHPGDGPHLPRGDEGRPDR
ncbi:PP2C family protein-serine/threonine phosphatase [Actinoplanes sp. NPDC026619]|uniref:PP2C family protein-serine/threonine phosphatase n=1 Tax=Actinoplanes sp. NPDC026619 TaxID=3155798 RepID=UPI00340F6251